VQKIKSELKIINHARGLITVNERVLSIILAVTGSNILTSRNARNKEMIIAIADSNTKNKIILFLFDPNILFTETFVYKSYTLIQIFRQIK
jgi:hypothetical protein